MKPKVDEIVEDGSISPKAGNRGRMGEDEESEEEEECVVAGMDEDEAVGEGEEIECGECEGGDIERVKASKEERVVKELTDPRKPSAEQIEKHNRHHMPYRNWCPICVKARGRDSAIERRSAKKGQFQSIRLINVFQETGYKLTVLAGRERVSGMRIAVTVPTKGSSGKFGLDCILAFMEECGDGNNKVIVKTDQ